MSGISLKTDNALLQQSAGTELLQNMALVMGRACLSSIPLAALAFDIGEKCIAFASKKHMDNYLNELVEQIENLKSSVSDLDDRLRCSTLYRIMTENALKAIASGEEDEGFLGSLRNAALNFGIESSSGKMTLNEIARIICSITPIQLRVLYIYDKFWRDDLTDSEKEVVDHVGLSASDGCRLYALVCSLIEYPYLDRTVRELRTLELLEPGIDGGDLGEERPSLDDVRLTQIGRDVLKAVLPPHA